MHFAKISLTEQNFGESDFPRLFLPLMPKDSDFICYNLNMQQITINFFLFSLHVKNS